MSKFDDFMIHYQDIDLVDINNVILESVVESGLNIDDVEMIVLGLFARGYVIINKGGADGAKY